MPSFGPTGGTGPARLETEEDGTLSQLFDQDLQLQYFVDHARTVTPDQIRTFVQNNIVDLASAQSLLTMICLWIARSSHRNRSNNQ